jgi:hypothetical protein
MSTLSSVELLPDDDSDVLRANGLMLGGGVNEPAMLDGLELLLTGVIVPTSPIPALWRERLGAARMGVGTLPEEDTWVGTLPEEDTCVEKEGTYGCMLGTKRTSAGTLREDDTCATM